MKVMELQIKITTMKASIAIPSVAVAKPAVQTVVQQVSEPVVQPVAQPNIQSVAEPVVQQVAQSTAQQAEITINGSQTAASNTIVVGNISPPPVTGQVITTNVLQPVATSNLTINANVVPIQAQVGVISVTPAVTVLPSLAVTPIGGIAGAVVGGISGGIAIGGIAI